MPHAWRWNSRTGGGIITDWGAHWIDLLQWTLGTDRTGPVAIENMTTDLDDDEVFDWAQNFDYDMVYADGHLHGLRNRPQVDRRLPHRQHLRTPAAEEADVGSGGGTLHGRECRCGQPPPGSAAQQRLEILVRILGTVPTSFLHSIS